MPRRSSAVVYNIRALGKYWHIEDLPEEWIGYHLLSHADDNDDNHISQYELLNVDWHSFVDAVEDFQKSQGLSADGKLGPNTLKKMQNRYTHTQQDQPLIKLGHFALHKASITTSEPEHDIIFGDTAEERSIAAIWNRYGASIIKASEQYDIPIKTALAVFHVESKRAYDPTTGLVLIRFEPHIFKRKANRSIRIKRGKQSLEWQNLTRAADLNLEAALLSTSFGLPQIMGFNWSLLGYENVEVMVTNFQDSCIEQISGFFKFLESTQLIESIRQQDWQTFVRGYNGPGNVPVYQANLINALRSIHYLEQDGARFVA